MMKYDSYNDVETSQEEIEIDEQEDEKCSCSSYY